jgi:hypothetical protein
VIAREPGTLTLRTLQTLAEVATEHNSTLVLPIPIDVLEAVRHHAEATTPTNGQRPWRSRLSPSRPGAPT